MNIIIKILKGGSFMVGCLFAIILWLIAMGISWGLTCCIVYLITLCFGLVFDWWVATGIWLVLFLVSAFFGSNNSSK